MRIEQGMREIRPFALGFLIGINPLIHLRHPLKCSARGLEHQLLGHASSQRINGLKNWNFRRFIFGYDMIGMDHLRNAVEVLYPP